MSLEPALPVYLFNLVSGLRDKSAKGYPIKKVMTISLHKALLIRFTAPSCLVENTADLLWWLSRAGSSEKAGPRIGSFATCSRRRQVIPPIGNDFSDSNNSHAHQVFSTRHRSISSRNFGQVPDFHPGVTTICRNTALKARADIQTGASLLSNSHSPPLSPRRF